MFEKRQHSRVTTDIERRHLAIELRKQHRKVILHRRIHTIRHLITQDVLKPRPQASMESQNDVAHGMRDMARQRDGMQPHSRRQDIVIETLDVVLGKGELVFVRVQQTAQRYGSEADHVEDVVGEVRRLGSAGLPGEFHDGGCEADYF